VHGIGIALLPEQVIAVPLKERLVERVLPEWSGAKNILHLVYPPHRSARRVRKNVLRLVFCINPLMNCRVIAGCHKPA
jgi:DNA-binding transcriptional LysR family regulator